MRKAERFVLTAWILLTPPALAETLDPAATIDAFHDTLIQVMRTPGYHPRYQLLDEAVQRYFDTPTISRISLGRRTWNSLEQAEQNTFEELIHTLIASSYAARFDSFNNQVFVTLDAEPITENRHRVRTQLVTNDETVSLDYQLQLDDASWRIYDVAANGVSDLSLKRSNYAALQREGGLAAVQSDIRQEISENEPD